MRPYLVWSYDYYPDSAGQKTMHRLCHELNLAGQEAYVAFEKRNPVWDTPYRKAPLSGLWIAVYPEIVRGNPWAAPYVARYVLNNPGKLGGDKTYHPAEMVFAFAEMFNDMGVPPERILHLPTIELDLYTDRHEPRAGAVYYVGKGQKSRNLDALEITNDLKRDQALLADTLNRAEVMYTFDMATAMIDIARLCGCPVVIISDDGYTETQLRRETIWAGLGFDKIPPPFDSALIRAEHVARYETFRERLTDFIRITQTA